MSNSSGLRTGNGDNVRVLFLLSLFVSIIFDFDLARAKGEFAKGKQTFFWKFSWGGPLILRGFRILGLMVYVVSKVD